MTCMFYTYKKKSNLHNYDVIYVIASLSFLFDHQMNKTYQLYFNKQTVLFTEQRNTVKQR